MFRRHYLGSYLKCMREILNYTQGNKLEPNFEKVISELFDYRPSIFEFDLRSLSEKYLKNLLEEKKKFNTFLYPPKAVKPKVELHVELTSKGNLAIWWGPQYNPGEGPILFDADFDCFGSSQKRDLFARPVNEIAFIRNMGCLVSDKIDYSEDDIDYSVDEEEDLEEQLEYVEENNYLGRLILRAVLVMISEIENTLSIFCKVSYYTNLEILKKNDLYYGNIYKVKERIAKLKRKREQCYLEQEKLKQEKLKTTLSPINIAEALELIASEEHSLEQIKTWLSNEQRAGLTRKLTKIIEERQKENKFTIKSS